MHEAIACGILLRQIVVEVEVSVLIGLLGASTCSLSPQPVDKIETGRLLMRCQMDKVVTLERALELVKQLSPIDKVRLIERIALEIRRDQMVGPPVPRKSLWGLCADLGPAPSAEDIDHVRKEEWGRFPREDI